MKLCFLASGDSIHSLKWVKYFSQRPYRVFWISLTPFSQGLLEYTQCYQMPGLGRVAPLNLPLAIKRLRRLLKSIQPDILHAHYAGANGVLTALSGFHPFILTVWGSDILINTKSLIKGPLIKFALGQADLITCDAWHMKNALEELGVASTKIKLINFGIDTKKFQPQEKSAKLRKQLGIGSRPTIISLRQLEPIYDVASLIQAVALLGRKIPDIACLIVGTGSEANRLKQLSRALKIQDKVIFVGRIPNDQLPDYLTSSDVYVSCALSDAGIAASTAEAMACGLPVVITDSGENRKWIHSGSNGFLVPVKNPQALAAKISHLLKHPELRQAFGQAGRKIIEEKNNYEQEMAKMETIYQTYAQ